MPGMRAGDRQKGFGQAGLNGRGTGGRKGGRATWQIFLIIMVTTEQFNFFRLPKLLVRDKRFDGLSSEAKILYGVLLDRMALSAQNGWLDDDNRIYIIYTTREVMREFGCSERKAITLMGELDTRKGIGLI